jgi:hypothetical protein
VPVRLPDDAEGTLPPDAVFHALAAEEPPLTALVDTAEMRAAPAPARALLLAVVMLGTVCLCLALVSLASFAGYRDGLATNDVRITQTLATGIAEQYATGVADLEQGYAELAAAALRGGSSRQRPRHNTPPTARSCSAQRARSVPTPLRRRLPQPQPWNPALRQHSVPRQSQPSPRRPPSTQCRTRPIFTTRRPLP